MNEKQQSNTGTRNRVIAGAVGVIAVGLMGVCCVKQGAGGSSSGHTPTAVATTTAGSSAATAAIGGNGKGELEEITPGTTLLEGYALGQPDELQELPKILREVSGLTDVSDSEVACVQDEEGTVFIYDLKQQKITRRIPFGDPGDYEALTRVDGTFFVLRSDGALFEIADSDSPTPRISVTTLKMPTRDNEGLCYDPIEHRLLISPKSRLGKSDEERRAQGLFAYSLKTRQADMSPTIVLDLSDVIDGREKVRETKRGRKRVLPSRFLPSSVTVHPKTGDFFVLSAVAHNLAVFNRQGELKAQQPLDPKLFPQPEGITFLPNQELIVVNEGVESKATLLRFKSRR